MDNDTDPIDWREVMRKTSFRDGMKRRDRYADASEEVLEIRRTRHAFLTVVLVLAILAVLFAITH